MEIVLKSNQKIILTPINARTLSVDFVNIEATEIRDIFEYDNKRLTTDKIIGLRYKKEKFLLGETLEVDGINYYINTIEPAPDHDYYFIEQKFNKSLYYLLPLISESGKNASNYLVNKCLVNTYLSYEGYNNPDKQLLFLKYKFFNNPMYKRLESELMTQSNFVDMIDIPNCTVFVFEIDFKYNSAYKLFLEGKYHCIDRDTQEIVLSYFRAQNPVYTRMFNWINCVFKLDKKELSRLETKLGITLPKGMNFESIPDWNLETLKL